MFFYDQKEAYLFLFSTRLVTFSQNILNMKYIGIKKNKLLDNNEFF